MRDLIEIIQLILLDKDLDGAGHSLRHILDKVNRWHFHITSNEVMWSNFFSNYIKGFKSAIWTVCSKRQIQSAVY